MTKVTFTIQDAVQNGKTGLSYSGSVEPAKGASKAEIEAARGLSAHVAAMIEMQAAMDKAACKARAADERGENGGKVFADEVMRALGIDAPEVDDREPAPVPAKYARRFDPNII